MTTAIAKSDIVTLVLSHARKMTPGRVSTCRFAEARFGMGFLGPIRSKLLEPSQRNWNEGAAGVVCSAIGSNKLDPYHSALIVLFGCCDIYHVLQLKHAQEVFQVFANNVLCGTVIVEGCMPFLQIDSCSDRGAPITWRTSDSKGRRVFDAVGRYPFDVNSRIDVIPALGESFRIRLSHRGALGALASDSVFQFLAFKLGLTQYMPKKRFNDRIVDNDVAQLQSEGEVLLCLFSISLRMLFFGFGEAS